MVSYNPASLVQPMNPGQSPAPQPPPQPVAPPEETQTATAAAPPVKLSPSLIKMPVMQALMAGAPPAVSMNIEDFKKKDEAEEFADHKKTLEKAGFGFYRSLSGQIGVIFNSLHIHPADIQAADKAGKLLQIAPPFDSVHSAVSRSGMHNPVLKRTAVPNGPATPTPQAAPQLSGSLPPGVAPQPMKQAPASVQKRMLGAQLANLQPGSPTSGPAPGQGRLMNQILKGIV